LPREAGSECTVLQWSREWDSEEFDPHFELPQGLTSIVLPRVRLPRRLHSQIEALPCLTHLDCRDTKIYSSELHTLRLGLTLTRNIQRTETADSKYFLKYEGQKQSKHVHRLVLPLTRL